MTPKFYLWEVSKTLLKQIETISDNIEYNKETISEITLSHWKGKLSAYQKCFELISEQIAQYDKDIETQATLDSLLTMSDELLKKLSENTSRDTQEV